MEEIPGWLDGIDETLLRFILRQQTDMGVRGDIAEMGVFMGKSAVVLGDHVQSDEVFTVIDLFELPAPDAANQAENSSEYPELTQREFERHYLSRHSSLPVVVVGRSQTIVDHARHGTHRLVHIDASHLYEHVVGDIAAAKTLLQTDGVVVFDDIREVHTPGVAAAVWGEVNGGGLRPLAISEHKFYGTWGEGDHWVRSIVAMAGASPWSHEVQQVSGGSLVRLSSPGPEPRSNLRKVAEACVPPALLYRLDRARSRFGVPRGGER